MITSRPFRVTTNGQPEEVDNTVFILYGVAAGLLIGLLLKGRPDRLGELQLRWSPLILAGLLVQLVLFSDPVTATIGSLGPPIYVASTAAVLAAVVRNAAVPGFPIVATGALANMAAIVANGGYMPAGGWALAAQSRTIGDAYSNSRFMANPALEPLTDIFAMPSWLPFANIFSLGDLLIGAGVAITIMVTMRAGSAASRSDRRAD